MKYVFLKIFYKNENIQFTTNWSYIIILIYLCVKHE